MTVTTELYRTGWIAWTGVETIFVPGFSAADLDDVTVEFRDAALAVTTLVRGVHFNATLGAGSNAFTAVPISLPPAPGSLRFTRDTPALQPVNFANLSGYDAAVHTRLHDAAAMREAELRGRVTALETGAVPDDPPDDPTTVIHQLDIRAKNACVNPGMELSTINGTSSIALTASGSLVVYPVLDHFNATIKGSFVAACQQVADAPPGLAKSMKFTVSTAQASLGATDVLNVFMPIEGYNIRDAQFGLATALDISLG